jgi:hypothetical protein
MDAHEPGTNKKHLLWALPLTFIVLTTTGPFRFNLDGWCCSVERMQNSVANSTIQILTPTSKNNTKHTRSLCVIMAECKLAEYYAQPAEYVVGCRGSSINNSGSPITSQPSNPLSSLWGEGRVVLETSLSKIVRHERRTLVDTGRTVQASLLAYYCKLLFPTGQLAIIRTV